MPEETVPTTTPPAETSSGDSDFEPITTAEDLKKIIDNRIGRERAKYADYADLKAKAEQFDKVTRTAEERIAAIENELKTERHNSLKKDVATDKGVPASLLTGSSREELEAAADELLKFRGETDKSKTKPAGGSLKSTFGSDTKLDPKERAAQALRQRSSWSH